MIVNEHRPRLNEEEWGVCVTGGSQGSNLNSL